MSDEKVEPCKHCGNPHGHYCGKRLLEYMNNLPAFREMNEDLAKEGSESDQTHRKHRSPK